jgi:5-carboxymethyl-2-hydroxymuconate isomerase
MSHMTLEYSANLREVENKGAGGGMTALCTKLAKFMIDLRADGQAVFPPGGVRVRALACEDYCVADGGDAEAGFVHANLKMGAGRSDAVKQATTHGLFEIMKSHFADQYANRGLALSLELNEFSEAGTLKHNNLHARLQGAMTKT